MHHHEPQHLGLITALLRVVQQAGNDREGALTGALGLLCEGLSASAGLAWQVDPAGQWRLVATDGAAGLVDAALGRSPEPAFGSGPAAAQMELGPGADVDIEVRTPRGAPAAALRLMELADPPDGPVLSALVEAIAGVLGHTCAFLDEQVRFEQAQQVTAIGHWQWRVDVDEVWCSAQMYRNLGVDPEVFDHTLAGYLARVHPEDRDMLAERVAASLAEGGSYRWAHRVVADGGATRWFETSGQVACDDDGVAVCVTGVGEDITERRAMEQELAAQAGRDELTGLANRRAFQQALQRCTEHQAGDQTVVVALVDVDGFRTFDEQFGWAEGDRVLQQLADRLRTVEEANLVARLSADEFALLFTRPAEDASGWVERLGEDLAARVHQPTPLVTSDGEPIGIAVGLATSTLGESQISDALLRSASVALQVAKARTNARWQVFDPDKHQLAMQRLAMESDLRRAVEQGDIELAYQPIIALDSGEITSVEALARWHRPGHGPVSPATFIPIAERVGLMPQLGAQLLDGACRQLHAWEQTHPRARGLRLTVNLSTLQLDDPHLVDTVQDVLARHQLAPDRLVLEVTETTISHDAPSALARLFELRRRGVRIAIDDFGTGYSSLARLREVPFDILKIDRSFIKDIVSRVEPTPILEALFAISRSLDLEVVAEGVETPVQLAVMLGHHCGYVQGFLFSPPLDPAGFEALLADQTSWDPARIAGQSPAPKTSSGLQRLLNQLTNPDRAAGQDVLDEILNALAELTGLDSVYLTRIDFRGQVQEIVAACNLGPVHVEAGRQVPWTDTLCRRALAAGNPVIADVGRDHPDATAAKEIGIGTYVGVEVHGPTGGLRGTLCGATAAVTEIPPDTIETLNWAARLLADALQREQPPTTLSSGPRPASREGPGDRAAHRARPSAVTSRDRRIGSQLRNAWGRRHGQALTGGKRTLGSALAEPADAEIRRLRGVLDAASDAYLCADGSAVVKDGNRAAERLFGYSRDELVGADLLELMSPAESRDDHRDMYQQIVAEGWTSEPVEVTAVRADGAQLQVELSMWVTEDDDEPTIHALYRDVTERRRLEEELADHARRLTEAQTLARIGSWEWDVPTGAVVWSTELYSLFGIDEGTPVTYATFLDRLLPDDREWVEAQIDTAALEGQPLHYEARIVRTDGDVRWIAVYGDTVVDSHGVPVRVVGTAHDITDRKLAELESEHLAVTDGLTGLANRTLFDTRLEIALASCRRTAESVALLMLDLDEFKPVNDTHGHPVGDAVLIEVSARLADCIRPGDTLARVGGDEFAVVLPGADRNDAVRIAQRLVEATSAPITTNDTTAVTVGASVGIAVAETPSTGAGELRRQADRALYTAKRSGRGQHVVYTE